MKTVPDFSSPFPVAALPKKERNATKPLPFLPAKALFIFLLLLLFRQGTAQPAADSSGQPQKGYILDLDVFKSPAEKSLFASLAADKEVDYLSLLLAADPVSASTDLTQKIRSRIDSFASAAGPLVNKPNVRPKDLKEVYAGIHKAFLSKYVDNPSFGQLFVNGNYNCATASALYVLLLEQLSVGYHIRETPDHVYLIAAPESHNLLFETTTPGARVLQFGDKDKAQFVEYLYNNKLISAEEWATGDKNGLFNKYYFTDELIDKRKLSGLLYFNLGVEALNGENFREAYRNFEKAYFLYPCKKIKYFVSVCLANVLVEKGMAENEQAMPYYLRFSEVVKKDLAYVALKDYLENLSQKLLFQAPDPVKYQKVYGAVSARIHDSDLLVQVRSTHYYNLAHYYSILHKPDASLCYLDSVFALNKGNLLVQELISSTLEQKMMSITNEKQIRDTLDHFFKRYPFITRQGRLGLYHAYALSLLTAKAFENNNTKEGNTHLAAIKELLEQPEIAKNAETYFSNAFVAVYHYYIRQKQYTEAKEFAAWTKKHYPDNGGIRMINERIDDILKYRK